MIFADESSDENDSKCEDVEEDENIDTSILTSITNKRSLKVLGYKYNLYLVTGGATLAIPVAAVGAVGATISAPTDSTYRLVKHIRSKRQEHRRRHHMETISREWTISDSLSTFIYHLLFVEQTILMRNFEIYINNNK
jgi:hypothetical protein